MNTTTQDYRDCIAAALMAQTHDNRRPILDSILAAHDEEARIDHIAPARPAQMKKAAKALAEDLELAICLHKHGAQGWRGHDAEKAATHARKCARRYAAWAQAQAYLSAANTARYWRAA